MKYLEKTQIMVNLGGIPTTLEHSGEQWDYPNAWPPLQYIMIMSLDATGDSWAQDLAYEMSERWVRSNFKAYNETGIMYEKVRLAIPNFLWIPFDKLSSHPPFSFWGSSYLLIKTYLITDNQGGKIVLGPQYSAKKTKQKNYTDFHKILKF